MLRPMGFHALEIEPEPSALEHVFGGRRRAHDFDAPEQRRDARQQMRQADVLGQVVVRAHAQAGHGVEVAIPCRQENDRQGGRHGAQFAAQREPALDFIRQPDVDQGEVRQADAHCLERVGTIGEGRHFVALASEHIRVVLADRGVVFDNGYAPGHGWSLQKNTFHRKDAKDAKEMRMQGNPKLEHDLLRSVQSIRCNLLHLRVQYLAPILCVSFAPLRLCGEDWVCQHYTRAPSRSRAVRRNAIFLPHFARTFPFPRRCPAPHRRFNGVRALAHVLTGESRYENAVPSQPGRAEGRGRKQDAVIRRRLRHPAHRDDGGARRHGLRAVARADGPVADCDRAARAGFRRAGHGHRHSGRQRRDGSGVGEQGCRADPACRCYAASAGRGPPSRRRSRCTRRFTNRWKNRSRRSSCTSCLRCWPGFLGYFGYTMVKGKS